MKSSYKLLSTCAFFFFLIKTQQPLSTKSLNKFVDKKGKPLKKFILFDRSISNQLSLKVNYSSPFLHPFR